MHNCANVISGKRGSLFLLGVTTVYIHKMGCVVHTELSKTLTNKCPNTSACRDLCGYSCHLHNRCSVWFSCIPTQLSAPRLRDVHTFSKILGFTEVFWWALSARCCNNSKLMTVFEYTKVLSGCTGKSPRIKVRRSGRPVVWTSMSCSLLSIESLNQVLSGNAGKMICCSIIHESHVLSFLKTHTFQEYWYII
jgi:hypothetical protein